jgi:hypothetical protein
MSHVLVTYRRGLDWMIGFIDTYAQYSELQVIERCRWSTHFTVHRYTRTRFLNLRSCILATDLQQSYCHVKWHMKSPFHSLIPFLPSLLNHLRLSSPEHHPILDSNWLKLTLLQLDSLKFWQLTAPLINFFFNSRSGVWSPNWVHSARRPLNGTAPLELPLCSLGWIPRKTPSSIVTYYFRLVYWFVT